MTPFLGFGLAGVVLSLEPLAGATHHLHLERRGECSREPIETLSLWEPEEEPNQNIKPLQGCEEMKVRKDTISLRAAMSQVAGPGKLRCAFYSLQAVPPSPPEEVGLHPL